MYWYFNHCFIHGRPKPHIFCNFATERFKEKFEEFQVILASHASNNTKSCEFMSLSTTE